MAPIAQRSTSGNPRRRARVRVEGLEARSLMAVSPIDPGFNGGQAIQAGTLDGTSMNSASAVAVQQDGKIVVVGTHATIPGPGSGSTVAVRRYNADGSVDTTFGTGGEADVQLALLSNQVVTASSNVLIQADGKIVLAANLLAVDRSQPYATFAAAGTVVVRLDADGSLDSTFGSNGATAITTDDAYLSNLSLQLDGKVVLAGIAAPAGATAYSYVVTRLDTNGLVDSSFNGGNLRLLDGATFGTTGYTTSSGGLRIQGGPAGVFATPGGAIVVLNGGVAKLNPDGSIATSFGTAGTGFVPNAGGQGNGSAALQPDGKIVLAGIPAGTGVAMGLYVTRLDPDGTVDPMFAAPAPLPDAAGPVRNLQGAASVLVLPDGDIAIAGSIVTKSSASGPATFRYAVERLTATGARDTAFGVAGIAAFSMGQSAAVDGLAAGPAGSVIAVGSSMSFSPGKLGLGPQLIGSAFTVAQLRAATRESGTNGDYDGDNISDVAAQLDIGLFGVRTYVGVDTLYPFGAPGVGVVIPVSGDFDGDGLADVAGYIVSAGTFAYRPSSGGPDRYLPFGTPGPGGSIPIAGDFDGDGKSDFGVYLPAAGAFALTFSGGTPNALISFGFAGAGGSIPAIGDYDGDGKADIAAYLPAAGLLAYRPSGGGTDVLTPFGSAGAGGSIPAPGDYDGDGRTDIAVYLPASGRFAIKPSNPFNAPYYAPFGLPGLGGTIPAPGDYDGDGITDVAAYLPALGEFAFRRSAGGPDVREGFGLPGAGATVPATSSPSAQAVVFRQSLGRPAPGAGVDFPLTEDLLAEIAGLPKKRKA